MPQGPPLNWSSMPPDSVEVQAPKVSKVSKIKPWNEIAKDFDPMMPADLYDGLRLKYFQDFVAPQVPKGKNVEATYAEFKKLTERPSLLSGTGRATLHGQVAAASAADALLAPLKDLHPDFRKAH